MKQYRTAIIGLGRIASTIDDEVQGRNGIMLPYSHMACYRDVPEIDVVAGADPFDSQRAAFGDRWGVDHLYADYREMLEKERPEIVSVATSAKPRPQIVIDCARAGVKLIFAEKPLSFSLAEADAMLGACRENGVIVAVGCTRRWDPNWSMVRSLIDAGEIGRVLQVVGMGQAGLSHNGSHLIDLVRFLAGGDIEWVVGEMESDEKAAGDDDLMGNGYLAFDNGARAFIRTWPSGAGDWDFEVVGETGVIRSVGNATDFEFWQTLPGGKHKELVRRVFPRPQRIQSPGVRVVLDLIECLETGKQPVCSGLDGRAALEAAIALRESHRQGNRRIDLPIENRALAIRSSETLAGDLPVALRRAAAAAS